VSCEFLIEIPLTLSRSYLSLSYTRMKIIFFDGNCPMCHSWVKRILRADKKKEIRFSPLEGKLAAEILTPLLPGYMQENTIVFFDGGEVFIRSDAALKILQTLGFPYSIGILGRLIPRPWRDAMYRWVANRRYLYGKRYDSCPLPPVEWRERFV
jgi:predicted DCC family thiol-disulfide oxidoreductase YuxK